MRVLPRLMDKALWNILFIICGCFLFHACQTILKEPVLTNFKPISVKKIDHTEVILSGELTYTNLNPIGGQLEQIFLNIYVNDVYLFDITQELKTEIQPNSEFVIPIDIRMPLQSLLDNKGGLLGGIVNALTQQRVKLKYVGTTTVRFAKMELPLVIDREEEIRIKL